jgi:hypothetical protein
MATYEEEVSQQAKVAAEKRAILERARNVVQTMVENGQIAAAADTPERRVEAFVSPVERNLRVLVKAGELTQVRDPNSPTGMRDVGRVNDVVIEFIDGICVLDESDPHFAEKLAWCQEHPETCRDIRDPYTEAWAYMKELQTTTANQEGRLPQNIDLERILRGDPSGNRVPHSRVERARDRAESLKQQ